jgi:aryl-alcohol dehydrogenase-like predicted oxidoreductase
MGELASRWGNAYLTELNFTIADEIGRIAAETGVERAKIALGWLAGRHDITSIIIGPRTLEQTLINLAGLDHHLTPETPPAPRLDIGPAPRLTAIRPAGAITHSRRRPSSARPCHVCGA